MDITPFQPLLEILKQSADTQVQGLGTQLLTAILSNKLKKEEPKEGPVEAGPDETNLEGSVLDQGFADMKKPDGVAKTAWDQLRERYANNCR